ncbi:replicative DNA helicase [Leptolyngbya sp. NIES-3755]|nr:replicative DNA helicase [Leptolyngbya sp. NIES-3755]
MVQDFNFQPVNDRIPPQNLDAEEAILGGILLDPEAITRILDILRSEAFYSSAHQEIYKACVALHQQGSPTDLMSVSTWLNDRGLLDKLGGQSKLVQLVDRTVSAVNIDQYATLVVDKYLRRKLISTGHQISQLGHETAKELEKVLDEAEQKVFSITQVRPNQGLIATADILTKTFAEIEERSAGMALPGLASGFYDLDGKTQGFQRSDLIIVAGRPSMGKCLAHDAELVLADGSIATIEEIYQHRQAELLTLNDNWKFSVTEPSAFIDDGIKPVFRVTTRLGRTVETTLTHPYLTLDGWLPLSSLRVGDRIAVPRIIDIFGKVSVAPSEIDRLIELSTTEIPSIVFQLVRDQLATFLNRLLENGDVLHHEKLARQVQHLLLRFGVVSQLQFSSAAQPVWKLGLIDAKSIEIFGSATHEAQAGSVLCAQRSAVLQDLANSEVYWDEITAIEFVGEKQVYDLTIPKTHNFVANDICVHNTAFCLGLGRNIAAQYKLPVAVFSLEMSKEQIVQRLLASEARIESGRLRSGRIASQDWEPLSNAIGRLSELRIFIDDTPNISVVEMRSRARKLQAEQGGALGMILIDYLQLMEGSGSENRVQELARITRALKGLARELNVPVIALSQLSRSVESRADKRPMMSDLRESGCLTGDTLVTLADTGARVSIADLVGKSGFAVWALNEETLQLERAEVSHAFSTGTKPIFRLTTRSGRSIRATGNHKFLTINGWKRLDELSEKEHLALPRQISSSISQTISDEKLALLGHLIGDGCTLPRHAIQYTTRELDLAEAVSNLATQAFGEALNPRIVKERDWYQVYLSATENLSRNTRNPIAQWLDNLGVFGLRSHEKFIPALVFEQSKSAIALFLRHLWSTDGCIKLVQGQRPRPIAYYASSSKQLAQGVQSLLLRFEINARLKRLPQVGKGRDQYHVTITGKSDMERFISEIGAVGQYKQQCLSVIKEYLSVRVANTNRDVVPHAIWSLYALPAMQQVGLTHRQMQAGLGIEYCGTGLHRQNLSRERTARLAEVVKSDRLYQFAESHVYWDEIVSIVPDGVEEVFDLTVPGLHNFVADDIIVHNSIEQDADLVMMLYRDEYYNEDTPDRGIAEVLITKHRNGPTGTIKLLFEPQFTRFLNLASPNRFDS